MSLGPLWVNWAITWRKGAPLTSIVHEIEIWKDKTRPRRMRSSILGGFRPDIRFQGEKSMPRGIARSASFPEVRNRKKAESSLTSSSYCSNCYEICTSWHFCPLKINFVSGIWRYPKTSRVHITFWQMFHNLINHLLLEQMFVVTSVDVFILPASCCFQHFLKMKAKQEPNVEDIALGSLFR